MVDLVEQSREDFSESGILSGAKGFEFRPEQQGMAVAVAECLETEGSLMVEAGTGVGKSLAYLIPSIRFALERGRKAVISTHTINLQEQLFYKDIPTVAKALDTEFRAALLKGRSNYLCRTRLQRALGQAGDLFNQVETKQLHDLLAWSHNCGEGSLAELPPELGIGEKVWAQVCSENHVCTARNCGPNCPYQAARRRVDEAEVVVLNHTLFFSLMAVAELTRSEEDEAEPEGFIFPRDFLIVDEAHTMETVAANQLGINLSQASLKYDLLRLYNPHTRKGTLRHHATPYLLQYIDDAQTAAEEFFDAAREDSNLEANNGTVRLRRGGWPEDILSPALEVLENEVKAIAQLEENEVSRSELKDIASRLVSDRASVIAMVKLDDPAYVYWVETAGSEGQFINLRAALIDVADLLREKLFEAQRALILTSATLSAGDRGINYFAGRVGGEAARQLSIGSPFNFEEQMRIVVARSMLPPPPASELDPYLDDMQGWIERSLDESQGRAFILFTSYSMLRHMAERLMPFCKERGWPLLAQGSGMNRTEMLARFKEVPGSVLLGAESFWTGVDVPGEAPANVTVTNIPFESPGNPLTEARCQAIEARGGRPCAHYTLP